jgi:hypothetical protein
MGQPGGQRLRKDDDMYDRRWTAVIAALAVALIATSSLALHQRATLSRVRAESARLTAKVDRLQQRVEELADPFGGLFDDLFDNTPDDQSTPDLGAPHNGDDDGGLQGLLGRLADSLDAPSEGDSAALSLPDQAELSACADSEPETHSPPADTEGAEGNPIAVIAGQVAADRGLDFTAPVDAAFHTSDQVADAVRDDLDDNYPADQADMDARILTALGAIPAGTDLRALVAGLLDAEIAGYYHRDTRQLVVRTDDPDAPLSAAQRVALAHELQHALADQTLGLPRHDPDDGDTDAARAALAVVEGDATLTMQRYAAAELGVIDLLSVAADNLTAGRDQLDTAPHYLQQELLFPYIQGLRFVCQLYADGGWPNVNQAYNTPPTTTAEVLFPDRYGDQPTNPRDPKPLPAPWTLARQDTLGAAELLWLLQAPGGDPTRATDDPRAAAQAWAGGELALWTDGPDTAIAIALDEQPGHDRLCASVRQWYTAAFPDNHTTTRPNGRHSSHDGQTQDALITCTDDQIRIGIAPDLKTASHFGL